MMLRNKIYRAFGWKVGLEADFDKTFSVKLRVGDRVKHRETGLTGQVYQTGTVDGTINLQAISVKYDNGFEAILLPAEEFTRANRY